MIGSVRSRGIEGVQFNFYHQEVESLDDFVIDQPFPLWKVHHHCSNVWFNRTEMTCLWKLYITIHFYRILTELSLFGTTYMARDTTQTPQDGSACEISGDGEKCVE